MSIKGIIISVVSALAGATLIALGGYRSLYLKNKNEYNLRCIIAVQKMLLERIKYSYIKVLYEKDEGKKVDLGKKCYDYNAKIPQYGKIDRVHNKKISAKILDAYDEINSEINETVVAIKWQLESTAFMPSY